jgi:hypothetical protein
MTFSAQGDPTDHSYYKVILLISASLRIEVFYGQFTCKILKDRHPAQINTLKKIEKIINLKMVVNCKSLTQIRIAAKNCQRGQALAAFGPICSKPFKSALQRRNTPWLKKY